MKRKTLIDIGILLFILIVVGGLIAIVLTQGSKCMQSPLVYGVKKMQESNDVPFTCTCSLQAPISPVITVTAEGLEIEYVPEFQAGQLEIWQNVSI